MFQVRIWILILPGKQFMLVDDLLTFRDE